MVRAFRNIGNRGMQMFAPLLVLCGLGLCGIAAPAEDLVIEDFEDTRDAWRKNPDRKWTFEGSAYSREARGEFREVSQQSKGLFILYGFQGKRVLASTSDSGVDTGTGRALSGPFTIERNYIKFLLSGGRYPGRTCLNLLVEGERVASATGAHSSSMQELAFDVSAYRGKAARIEVLDREEHLWGHICVDRIVQSAVPAPRVINPKDRAAGFQGTVHTLGGIRSGLLYVADGQLHMDKRPLPLEELICVNFNPEPGKKGSATLVRLANGDSLFADFELHETGVLKLVGAVIGAHEIDLQEVAQLDFNPRVPGGSSIRNGFLYRDEGDPIPGKPVKVTRDTVSFDCPLGIVELPRIGLVRYGFARENESGDAGPSDEIGLVDGSILSGKVTLDGENLVLAHPVLPSISVAWTQVNYFRRARPDVLWLSQVRDVETRLQGAPFPAAAPHAVDARAWGGQSVVHTIRLGAETVAVYPLPAGGKRVFRARVAPLHGSRGEVVVGLEVSGRTLFKEALASGAGSKVLSLDLPAGDTLTVHVSFGERLSYPCGIDLGDAYVVSGP
jgi:hypothetical protein